MPYNLLKQKYQDINSLKGRNLVLAIGVVALFSILIGFLINYSILQFLKSPEIEKRNDDSRVNTPTENLLTKQGKVVFIEPLNFQQDEISFYLADEQGERIILLTADDQKLNVVEGLTVEATGTLEESKSTGEDVLRVVNLKISNNL